MKPAFQAAVPCSARPRLFASSLCARRADAAPRRACVARHAPRMGILDALRGKPSAKAEAAKPDAQRTRRVARINALEPDVEKLSREELAQRVAEIRASVQDGAALEDALEEMFAIVREASFRALGLRHYDVQLEGAMILNDGCIAEMATGEGKTLVAALASALNALNGEGVFVVTVNDYLAKRDAELVGQVHRYLGLSVGLIQGGLSTAERREAYECDITYVTNSELGFDYLRDNLALSDVDVVIRRPLGFCIVDEADSILIDEARTPLIISGKVPANTEKYATAARAADQLERMAHYEVNEKEQSVLLSENGYRVLETALGVKDLFDPQNPWAPYVTNALKAKEIFAKDVNYVVRDEEQDIQIVDEFTGRVMEGRRWSDGLHQAVEAKEGLPVNNEASTIASISYQAFFQLFSKLAGMTGTAATEADEIRDVYGLKVISVPTALPVGRKDYEDVIFRNSNGKYRSIMAEIARVAPTGRPILVGTTSIEASEALSKLLEEVGVPHEVLNAKPESALRESEIVAQAGRMYSITIATNMAGRGTDILLGGNTEYFARALARKELVSKNETLYTAMVEDLETSILIDDEDLPCDLTDEAFDMLADAADKIAEDFDLDNLLEVDELVAVAAEYGPIPEEMGAGVVALREVVTRIKNELADTVAEEREAVIKTGGLYVIGTERAESRRVDNQLRGRAGRQGDPGASRFFLALDDRLFRVFGGDKVTGLLNAFRVDENTPIENKTVTGALDNAQKNVEKYYADIRQQIFIYDEVMSMQRAALYAQRRRLVEADGDTLLATLAKDCEDTALEIVDGYVNKPSESDNFDGLSAKLLQFFPDATAVGPGDLEEASKSGSIDDYVLGEVTMALTSKNEFLQKTRTGMSAEVARFLFLTQVDNTWQTHMKSMDYLKEFVVLRAYSSENPLDAYKQEGFELFEQMLESVRRNTVYSYFQYDPASKAVEQAAETARA